jgi:hypothetical protein
LTTFLNLKRESLTCTDFCAQSAPFVHDISTGKQSVLTPHPAADLALMSQILKPSDVVRVEGKRRISTAIKYLTQSSWSHAAIYVGGCGGLDSEGRVRAFVEADIEKGVRAFPIEEPEGLHLRICRPVGYRRRTPTRLLLMSYAS